jgi:hypothetical protein
MQEMYPPHMPVYNGILMYDSKNHIPVSLHPSTSGIAAIILAPFPRSFTDSLEMELLPKPNCLEN